jgi:hypothetical protein
VGAGAAAGGVGPAGGLDSPQPAINPAMPISRKKRMFMKGLCWWPRQRSAANATGQILLFILSYESREEIASSSFQSHHGFFRVGRKVPAVYARIALFID